MRIEIKWKSKRIPAKVTFLDADNIDRTRFAEALGVKVPMATRMIRDGYVPQKHIEAIKKLKLKDVMTLRKPIARKDL